MKLFKVLDDAIIPSNISPEIIVQMLKVYIGVNCIANEMLPMVAQLIYCHIMKCPRSLYNAEDSLIVALDRYINARECMLGMIVHGAILSGPLNTDTEGDPSTRDVGARMKVILELQSEMCYLMVNTIVGEGILLNNLCRLFLEGNPVLVDNIDLLFNFKPTFIRLLRLAVSDEDFKKFNQVLSEKSKKVVGKQ